MKPLNECVLREIHPLPKVDETLVQLSGAKIFSKLDANSGFWQITQANTKCDHLHHTFRPIQCLRSLPILGQDQSTRKIFPKSGTVDRPLQEPFSKNCTWMWGSSPTEAFTTVKEELTQPTVLALYDTMA